MKIGILITRANAEKKKDELVLISSRKRPWLSEIYDPSKHKSLSIKSNGKLYVPGDVSIGFYILWNWKNVEVDFIHPHEISPKRLSSNDMNFMIIYDLIESFHVDSNEIYTKFKNTLKHCKNIYPPYEYQKFINNKCNYITHLSSKKKSVIPTQCITREFFKQNGLEKTIQYLKGVVDKKKWTQFIGKPILGQESIDFAKFETTGDRSLGVYIKRCMSKYPGLIFQKYIEGFDKSNPEIRLYYIGNEYKYSVVTTDKTVKIPKSEKGTAEIKQHKELISFGNSVLASLPKINIEGKHLPRLLTRIDIACQKDYEKPWYVNEIEFVPSLYIQDVNFIPDIDMGDNMIKICKKKLLKVQL